MNLSVALRTLQDFRSQLEDWGITSGLLILIGTLSAILVFISFREILGWYLKTHLMREEIQDLRRQLEGIQKVLEEVRDGVTDLEAPLTPLKKAQEPEEKTPGSKHFRLDH